MCLKLSDSSFGLPCLSCTQRGPRSVLRVLHWANGSHRQSVDKYRVKSDFPCVPLAKSLNPNSIINLSGELLKHAWVSPEGSVSPSLGVGPRQNCEVYQVETMHSRTGDHCSKSVFLVILKRKWTEDSGDWERAIFKTVTALLLWQWLMKPTQENERTDLIDSESVARTSGENSIAQRLSRRCF